MNYTNKSYPVEICGMPFSVCNLTRCQYRIIANLDKQVNPDVLQKAVDKVVPRFPMYTVAIQKKWHSIRKLTVKDMKVFVQPFTVQQKPFDFDSQEPLFRVQYAYDFIALEIFHMLTDANGAIAFLNSILACYFELLGEKVDFSNIIHYDSPVDEEEFEDPYPKYAKKAKSKINPLASLLKRRFIPKYKLLPDGDCIFTTYSFDSQEIKTVAKKYNATIHEYLVSVMCLAYDKIKKTQNTNKCTRIQMPINLRHRFPSKTLRNFVATTQFATTSNDKQTIISDLKSHMLLATSPQELQAFVYKGYQSMGKILRRIPRFIGDGLLKFGDKMLGEKMSNTCLSNVGVIKNNLSNNGVVSYEVLVGTPYYVPFLVSANGFANILNICFSRIADDNVYQQYFLQELAKDGITPQKTVNRK